MTPPTRHTKSSSARRASGRMALALLLITEARCRSGEIYPVPCAGDASTNGTAFRTAVETALNNSEIALGSCTYQVGDTMRDSYNTGILISGKTGLTIRGNGQGQTIVTFTRKVYIGFEIRSNTRNLTIKDMTIAGSVLSPLCQENGFDDGVQCYTSADGSRPATHGVASTGGQTGIDGVVLTNLELKDLAVGISVGSELAGRCVANTYLNATVSNNYIHDMRGKYGGSGYGIHSACAQDVVIRKNTIARAQRHSIYQGKTPLINDKPIRIVSNVIIVPGHGPELYGPNVAALAMARSTNVTAVDNKIVGGHTFGVSAEWDPVT